MRKPFDELTIQDNFMFSKVMLNEKICKQFLEMILRIKIQKLEFPSYERTIDIRYDAKSIRLDVILEDEQHTTYNLEMQATPHDYLIKRTRYYQDLIDLDLIEKGQGYEELGTSLIIFVCTFDPFDRGRHIYSFENICKEDSSLFLADGTKKVFVNTKGTMDDIDEELRQVLEFFNGFTAKGDFAKELEREVERVKATEKWRREYMTLEIFMQDARREERAKGREEGREEGRAEGRAEGGEYLLVELICKKLAKGKNLQQIADELERREEDIRPIVEIAMTYAPEYDIDQICECLAKNKE